MIFAADIAIRVALGKAEPFERDRVRDGFGWWAPDMRPHWQRLGRAFTQPSDLPSAAINLPVEWVRLDPSRGVKLLVFDQAILWAIVVAIVA